MFRASRGKKSLRTLQAKRIYIAENASRATGFALPVRSHMNNISLVAALVAAMLSGSGVATAIELPTNDYPTTARADYVFACMQTNGQGRDVLESVPAL